MKNNKKVAGQLNLFSLVLPECQCVPVLPKVAVQQTVVEEVLSSAEAYLRRGERITNIAKEHLKRNIESHCVTWSDELLYGISLNAERMSCAECLSKVRLIVGKYLRSIKEEGDEACKAIYELTGKRVRITLHPLRGDIARCVNRKKCINDTPICLHIYDGDEEIFTTYSMKDYAFPVKYRMILLNCGDLISDARTIIAYCALYYAVEKVFCGPDTDLKALLLKEASIRSENTYAMQTGIVSVLEAAFAIPGVSRKTFRPVSQALYSLREKGNFLGLKLSVPADSRIDEFTWSVLEKYGVKLIDEERTQNQIMDARRKLVQDPICNDEGEYLPKQISRILTEPGVITGKLVRESCFKQLLWPLALTMGELPSIMETCIKTATFGRGRQEHIVFQDTEYCGMGRNDGWLFNCFFILYKMQHAISEQWSDYEKSEGAYAKSYMLKSNIPTKTIAAMEKSELNSYFGFVEYDESVDPIKVAEVEKQFIAVKETYLRDIDGSRNAIRFRKLGNHKASGLYYPGVKCLCVDYRYTDSFIHEYGHLIDYENDSLSLKGAFYPIRVRYEECLKKDMQNNCALDAKMNGKSKYNLSYYLKPTEIFARSFELYCSKVLGVSNDLLPAEFNVSVYPYKDECYMDAVTAYFDALLNISRDVSDTDGEEELHEVA